jgi:hypothetical protein
MSEMGDMKFTTAGDMMMDLPTRLESWAQNEELVASRIMTEHGQDCIDAAQRLRAMRTALHDLAKHIWRGDWDKLEPETRAMLGENE